MHGLNEDMACSAQLSSSACLLACRCITDHHDSWEVYMCLASELHSLDEQMMAPAHLLSAASESACMPREEALVWSCALADAY